MLERVRKFFETQVRSTEPDHRGSREHRVRLATAALLIEISRADAKITADERRTIIDAVQRAFDLTIKQTRELVALAEGEVEHATSLYQFTRLVDAEFSPQEKKQVVQLMWRVSFADGDLDKYEEYLVRKIADLLHVSHADFIHAKHLATDED